MRKYIHYGADCFCRYKFLEVRNDFDLESTKPAVHYQHAIGGRGGLWGSPFGGDSVRTWAEWWADHNKSELRQVSFLFWIREGFEVIEITPGNVAEFSRSGSACRALDFELLASRFAAMFVSYSTIEALKDSTFRDWECDTILVFDKNAVGFDPDD